MHNPEEFGPRSQYDFDSRSDQLFEWACASGQGVMGISDHIPNECVNFCLEQYERFKVRAPEEIHDVIIAGIRSSFIYVDCVDPYCLYFGISDIDMTDTWSMFAYEVKTGRHYEEVNPEYLETFEYVPGQAEAQFNYMMSNPGLRHIPSCGASSGISDVLEGEWHGIAMDESDEVSVEARNALKDLCRYPDGSVNKESYNAYFELAAWASFAWIAGPLSRQYRALHSDIQATALRHGECILTEGIVLDPGEYRRLERSPVSCHKCGISAWCVELMIGATGSRHICEHCLSEGMPPMGRATCGTKICMLGQCPHNPYHGYGAGGLHGAYRSHGQLVQKVREKTPQIQQPTKILLQG